MVSMLGNNLDSVRRHNLSMILDLVHRQGAISRSALTRATGLNRSTVAALVAELVSLELVVETEPDATNSVGRPSPQVRPRTDRVAIAVNPEIDAITVGVVGFAGVVTHRIRRETERAVTADEAVALIAGIVAEFQQEALIGKRVVAIGLAIPGLVRASDGVVRWAPHLEWFDEPVGDRLQQATGYPVFAGNDANLGALAEHIFGAGRGVRDLVYLNGGASGIGGGVIANGAPLGGLDGFAGEFGQNRPGFSNGIDRATRNGTLENEVSRSRLLAAVGLAGADEPQLEAALLGATDPVVRAELDRQVRILSVALSNAINVLNPELVVLGGFLAALYAWDSEALERFVGEQAVRASFEGVRIVPAELGADLLMIGAAQLAFDSVLEDPARHG